jgi:hypothetical protein
MKRDPVYVQLQKHLDKQPVGYPSTWSGSEIEILKHIFSAQEAQIALGMSYKFDTAADIMKRLNDMNLSASRVSSAAELEGILDELFKKGGLLSKVTDGVRYFALAPLVVGMYELQNHRLTPDFIKHFKKYTKDKRFGIEFLSTERPQMRTIPIAESISNTRHVSPFDEVTSLIANAHEPFAILECICRKKKTLEGETCKVTDRKETCLAMGDMAEGALHMGIGRVISREEALESSGRTRKKVLCFSRQILRTQNSSAPVAVAAAAFWMFIIWFQDHWISGQPISMRKWTGSFAMAAVFAKNAVKSLRFM